MARTQIASLENGYSREYERKRREIMGCRYWLARIGRRKSVETIVKRKNLILYGKYRRIPFERER